MKLEVERKNFYRSSRANARRQALTPTREREKKAYLSMLVVRRRWKNSWEQTRHAHMQGHLHILTFPVTMFPFFSVTELHIC